MRPTVTQWLTKGVVPTIDKQEAIKRLVGYDVFQGLTPSSSSPTKKVVKSKPEGKAHRVKPKNKVRFKTKVYPSAQSKHSVATKAKKEKIRSVLNVLPDNRVVVKEIAQRSGLAYTTVQFHIQGILRQENRKRQKEGKSPLRLMQQGKAQAERRLVVLRNFLQEHPGGILRMAGAANIVGVRNLAGQPYHLAKEVARENERRKKDKRPFIIYCARGLSFNRRCLHEEEAVRKAIMDFAHQFPGRPLSMRLLAKQMNLSRIRIRNFPRLVRQVNASLKAEGRPGIKILTPLERIRELAQRRKRKTELKIRTALRRFPGGGLTIKKLSQLSQCSLFTLCKFNWRRLVEQENKRRKAIRRPLIEVSAMKKEITQLPPKIKGSKEQTGLKPISTPAQGPQIETRTLPSVLTLEELVKLPEPGAAEKEVFLRFYQQGLIMPLATAAFNEIGRRWPLNDFIDVAREAVNQAVISWQDSHSKKPFWRLAYFAIRFELDKFVKELQKKSYLKQEKEGGSYVPVQSENESRIPEIDLGDVNVRAALKARLWSCLMHHISEKEINMLDEPEDDERCHIGRRRILLTPEDFVQRFYSELEVNPQQPRISETIVELLDDLIKERIVRKKFFFYFPGRSSLADFLNTDEEESRFFEGDEEGGFGI